jgi:hypothetical protein
MATHSIGHDPESQFWIGKITVLVVVAMISAVGSRTKRGERRHVVLVHSGDPTLTRKVNARFEVTLYYEINWEETTIIASIDLTPSFIE